MKGPWPHPAPLPIAISHADKVFWPEDGYTKLDLAKYYDAVFPHLVSFLKARLLTSNGFAQTVVAPFSVRRRPQAPVSTPLDWSEVTPTLVPSDFNLGNFAERLKGPNPWRDFFRKRQSLRGALTGLSRL